MTDVFCPLLKIICSDGYPKQGWWKRLLGIKNTPCSRWVMMRGANPQTGAQVERGECIEAANVVIGLERNFKLLQMIASFDDLRNKLAAMLEMFSKIQK
jgi:hypothetical protein